MIPSGMLHGIKLRCQRFSRIHSFQSKPLNSGSFIIFFVFQLCGLIMARMRIPPDASAPFIGHASQQKYNTGR